MNITDTLRRWYNENKRDLPWRNTKDPYKIWLSEIILQQTRVNQGISYYYSFLELFPDVASLANASPDKILKTWQGLGYYNRARNLYETAKKIHYELNNEFPDSYTDLIKLKGVGEYTAAAIASFAYNEPVALVDGNVQRFLSRLYGVYNPINSASGKKEFKKLANQMLDRESPENHNQAMIEFGAIHCTPKNPNCAECPFQKICHAYNNDIIDQLPVKKKAKKKKNRFFNYLIIKKDKNIFLEKRDNNDIWSSLFQFPLIESRKEIQIDNLSTTKEWKTLFGNTQPVIKMVSQPYIHILTHQKIHARFIKIELTSSSGFLNKHFISTPIYKIDDYAVPRLIERFLENENLE